MKKKLHITKTQAYIVSIAALVLIVALIGVLLYACSPEDGGNVVGSWKTRPQIDEAGNVISIPDEENYLFVFESGGTGSQSLPEFGETVIVSFKWKTSGTTLTITHPDNTVNKFTYRVDGHILTLTPEGKEVSMEFIKQPQ